MKKSSLFILYFVFAMALSVTAQKNEGETPKGQIGITFSSFGENDVIRLRDLIGAASYNGDKFSVFANPYLKVHSLIPFSSDNYHQRLMESGFRLGLMVQL